MLFTTKPPFVWDEAKEYHCPVVAEGFESDIVVPDPDKLAGKKGSWANIGSSP